jgi:hypothetical protein
VTTVGTQTGVVTADTDVVVLSYNLVLRNNNFAGTGTCPVLSGVSLNGGPQSRQTVTQVEPGVGNGGQTLAFFPGAGTHTFTIHALVGCLNMSADVTTYSGGQYGSTMTTMVIKR